MKIEIVKQNFGEECSYKYKPMSFCCEKLEKNPVIELVDNFHDDSINYWEDPHLCITQHEVWEEWGEEFENYKYFPLTYCPFCGEKIKTEIVKEEDVSDEYDRIRRERDILWKGSQVTDSKSKEMNLRKKVQELDEKIAYYNDLREYKEKF